jgi:hypothetical protein
MNSMYTGLPLAIRPFLWLLGNPPRDKQTRERFLGVPLIKTCEGTFSTTLIPVLAGCFSGDQHQFLL